MGGIMKRTMFLMTIIALGLTFGCAQKGKDVAEDFNRAAAAIQTARTAEAGTYAPLDLRIAEDKLADAHTAGTRKNYDKARMLADEARINAQLAEKKADAEKAKRATKEIHDSIEGLDEAISKP
jgi:hypothetical protein